MKDRPTPGLRRVLELAVRAPSVHNTQPWRWRIVDGATVELYADRTRQLAVADPEGRNLALSCGAAVHHLAECARIHGLDPLVELLPVASEPDFLARVRLAPGRPCTDAPARLEALERRCTDRRRFTSWPVPDSRLDELARAVEGTGAHAVPVLDVTARFRADLLVGRAMSLQASDPRFAREQAAWVARSRSDGVPSTSAFPPRSLRRAERPNRFVPHAHPQSVPEPVPGSVPASSQRALESSDGLMALCTTEDDPLSWLEAGQALSALWLAATRAGLSVVPLSQVIETGETRQALREDVFAGTTCPQLLLRVGWQEIARTTLPRTPRRALDEVLLI